MATRLWWIVVVEETDELDRRFAPPGITLGDIVASLEKEGYRLKCGEMWEGERALWLGEKEGRRVRVALLEPEVLRKPS